MADVFNDVMGAITPKLVGPMMIYVLYLFVFATLAMVLFALFRHKVTCPVKINVRKSIGSGTSYVIFDGKIVNINGFEQLYVWQQKKHYPKPMNNRLLPMRGLVKKYCVYMYMDEQGSLVPEPNLDTTNYKSNLVLNQQDLQMWGQLQRQRVRNEYQPNWWGKYGVLVGETVVVMMLIVVTFIIMNKHVEASNIMAQALRETATIVQSMHGG